MTSRMTFIGKILHFLGYGAVLTAGLVYLIAPVESFVDVVARWQLITAASLLSFGGLLGIVAVVSDRPWFERIGLPALIGSMFVYIVASVARIISGDAPSPWASCVIVCFRLVALAWVLSRAMEVKDILRGMVRNGRGEKR